MKKITLLLCLSFVGFIGYAQETNQKENKKSNKENVLIIQIGELDFEDAADQELLTANDFRDFNFGSDKIDHNTHELVHRSSNHKNLEYDLEEGEFSLNEYALNIDYEMIKEVKSLF